MTFSKKINFSPTLAVGEEDIEPEGGGVGGDIGEDGGEAEVEAEGVGAGVGEGEGERDGEDVDEGEPPSAIRAPKESNPSPYPQPASG